MRRCRNDNLVLGTEYRVPSAAPSIRHPAPGTLLLLFTLFTLITLLSPYGFSAPYATAGLHAPAKSILVQEAELFKGLISAVSGVGLVSESDRKILSQTIGREKAAILRRTMEQVYANAYEMYREGRVDEALAVLRRISVIDPTFDRAQALLGALSSESRAGKLEAVRSTIDIVRDRFYEAIATYRDGRKVEAVQKFEQVLALEPSHRKARFYIDRINNEIAKDYFERGKYAKTNGSIEDALAQFYTAVSLDPKNFAFLSQQITDMEGEARSKKLQNMLSRALGALASADWQGARQQASEIFRIDPASVRAQEIIEESLDKEAGDYLRRGDALAESRQFEGAIAEFQRAIKLGRRADDAGRKIETAKAAIRRSEELARRRAEEADRERARKEQEEAEVQKQAEAAPAPAPGEQPGPTAGIGSPGKVGDEARQASESHYQQAMQFYQLGEMDRALVELNLSLKFDPNNTSAYGAKKRIMDQIIAK